MAFSSDAPRDRSNFRPASRNGTERTLLEALLDIGAVKLQPTAPFTWSSGLVAPIYCDNRLTISHPRVRRLIRDGFAETLRAHEVQDPTVAGTATAGIPHAAWLAEAVDRPMVYVRSAAKDHGTKARIEGVLETGTEVVVVEDLISTGESALDAVAALRQSGATVRAVFAIFSYELDVADEAFREAEMTRYVLATFDTLVDVVRERGNLSESDVALLTSWHADPAGWSVEHGGDHPDQ